MRTAEYRIPVDLSQKKRMSSAVNVRHENGRVSNTCRRKRFHGAGSCSSGLLFCLSRTMSAKTHRRVQKEPVIEFCLNHFLKYPTHFNITYAMSTLCFQSDLSFSHFPANLVYSYVYYFVTSVAATFVLIYVWVI
jgi:hypothetical protein